MFRCRIAAVAVAAAVLVGCAGGTDGPRGELVPGTGRVLVDGEPLAGATVMFIPTGETEGIDSFATTDSEGNFVLRQRGRDGVAAGLHKVVISKELMKDGSEPPPGQGPADSGAVESLPRRYSDPDGTELKVDTSQETPPWTFDLKRAAR